MKKQTDYIGNTPVIRLKKATKSSRSTIWAKLENLNPGGSIKDRACFAMLNRAERENLIKPGKTTVIEASSGNTAIGLALCCREKGYDLAVVLPENTAGEKIQLIKAFKARVILTPADLGLSGSIKKAWELARENPDFYLIDQFRNDADIRIHKKETVEEIRKQIPGHLDAFVCGFGTGGTATGLGQGLKEIYPRLKIVVVEPQECAILSDGKKGPHGICGISPGFIPEKLDTGIIDRVFTVSTETAREYVKTIACEEGILVGISSGACLYGALEISKEIQNEGQILTIFCDSGETYLASELYR